MMVPELQGQLLDDYCASNSGERLVYDPFVGSGTVLVEAASRGLDFYGADLNPIAVLLSQVKSSPPSRRAAAQVVERVVHNARRDSTGDVHNFRHRDKWFTPKIALQLTQLRSAIVATESPQLRRFLWICLAETIRFVSNSRLTTFKLHAYSEEALRRREPDALTTFELVATANVDRAAAHREKLREAKLVTGKEPSATVVCRDVNRSWTSRRLADVVMTSPPYGDNHTTIPYGQYSYLPMNWIDPRDLPRVDPSWLTSIGALDTSSLGGSRARLSAEDLKRVQKLSASLRYYVEGLTAEPRLQAKVATFARDYARSLQNISDRLRPGGFSFWTLGERRVGGTAMPLVAVTREVLHSLGHEHVTTIERRLPSNKRMGVKNSLGATMLYEHILITRKQLTT